VLICLKFAGHWSFKVCASSGMNLKGIKGGSLRRAFQTRCQLFWSFWRNLAPVSPWIDELVNWLSTPSEGWKDHFINFHDMQVNHLNSADQLLKSFKVNFFYLRFSWTVSLGALPWFPTNQKKLCQSALLHRPPGDRLRPLKRMTTPASRAVQSCLSRLIQDLPVPSWNEPEPPVCAFAPITAAPPQGAASTPKL